MARWDRAYHADGDEAALGRRNEAQELAMEFRRRLADVPKAPPSHALPPSDLVKRLNHLWLQATDFAEGETLREAAAALSATLTLKWNRLAELAEAFPELNPNNFDEEDVRRLNNWGIEVYQAFSAPMDGGTNG